MVSCMVLPLKWDLSGGTFTWHYFFNLYVAPTILILRMKTMRTAEIQRIYWSDSLDEIPVVLTFERNPLSVAVLSHGFIMIFMQNSTLNKSLASQITFYETSSEVYVLVLVKTFEFMDVFWNTLVLPLRRTIFAWQKCGTSAVRRAVPYCRPHTIMKKSLNNPYKHGS